MSDPRGTVHSIQFLRFVAATLVVVFHAHLGLTTRLTGGGSATEAYLFGFGAVGVHIFFVISGYIMVLTAGGGARPFSARRFFARRLIRIYPIYWLFAGAYLAVGLALGAAPRLGAGELAGALALWPGHAARIVGPAWTLSFELFFYAMFGLAMLAGARRGLWALTLGFPALIAAGVVLRPTAPALLVASSALLLEFVAGAWIARLTQARAFPAALGWLLLAGSAAGYAAAGAAGYDSYPTLLTLGLPSALLVAGAVVLERAARRAHPLLVRLSTLGDSSYTLYLCHILLITLAVAGLRAIGVREGRFALTLAIAVVSIAVAHLIYRTVERPLTRGLQRRFA